MARLGFWHFPDVARCPTSALALNSVQTRAKAGKFGDEIDEVSRAILTASGKPYRSRRAHRPMSAKSLSQVPGQGESDHDENRIGRLAHWLTYICAPCK
jgi:hypothetical protein